MGRAHRELKDSLHISFPGGAEEESWKEGPPWDLITAEKAARARQKHLRTETCLLSAPGFQIIYNLYIHSHLGSQ